MREPNTSRSTAYIYSRGEHSETRVFEWNEFRVDSIPCGSGECEPLLVYSLNGRVVFSVLKTHFIYLVDAP